MMVSKLISSLLLALTPQLLPKTEGNRVSKSATLWRVVLIVAIFYLALPAGCLILSNSSKEYSQCVSEISENVSESVEDTVLGGANGVL